MHYFNPRTPCGVRPGAIFETFVDWRFQSTHPMRGATVGKSPGRRCFPISIHAPHAGCDQLQGFVLHVWVNFNPRTPCGVRHSRVWYPISVLKISIHAPHAGCDCTLLAGPPRFPHFNPRTPCGVRLSIRSIGIKTYSISIHAPHAGCDHLDEI